MKKFVALACMFVFTCAAAITLLAWPTQASPQLDLSAEAFALTNAYRASQGRPALLPGNANLQAAANMRAQELSVQYSHMRPPPNNPVWITVLPQNGITDWLDNPGPNENIWRGFATPQQAVDTWAGSSGHRATMLGNFTHLSVGVHRAGNGELFWVQIFITLPAGSMPTTTTTTTTSTTSTTSTTPTTTTSTTSTTSTTPTTTTSTTSTTSTTPTTTTSTTTTAGGGTTTTTTTSTTPTTTTTAGGGTTTTTTTTSTAPTTTTGGGATTTTATPTTTTTTTVFGPTLSTTTTQPPTTQPPSTLLGRISAFFVRSLAVVFSTLGNLSLLV